MRAREFLARSQQKVVTCGSRDTIEAAAAALTSHNIGAMPVINATGALVGIISERDLVRAFAAKGFLIQKLTVGDLMTRDVATCGLDDIVISTRTLMKKHGCRHVPIVESGKVRGIISIRDTLECKLQEQELEVNVLRDSLIVARHR